MNTAASPGSPAPGSSGPEQPDRDRILENLAADARVLRASRALPEGTLPPEMIAQVRDDFRGYTARLGLFDQAVAPELGIDAAELVGWRCGAATDETAEALARQVNAWMETDARRRELRAGKPVNYVPTRLAEEMRGIANAAHALNCIGVIVVPAGCGKTIVLKYLQRQMAGVYFYCNEGMSPGSFLRLLGRTLGLGVTGGSIAENLHKIIAKLYGTSRILLLDEAQRLGPRLLSTVRTIYDLAEVPVVLAGSASIIDCIDEADRASGGGQLSSRCIRFDAMASCLNVDDPDFTGGGSPATSGGASGGGRPLFTVDEVARFFSRMQIRLDPDALRLLWAIACLPGHGCLRTATRIVQLLQKQAPAEVVTRRAVLGALPLLFGPHGQHIGRLAGRYIETAGRVQVA